MYNYSPFHILGNNPEALKTEYQNFTSIGNHPNVIQMIGTGEINGKLLFIDFLCEQI